MLDFSNPFEKKCHFTVSPMDPEAGLEINPILDVKRSGNKLLYLTDWKSFEERSWESKENLHVPFLIHTFHQQFPHKEKEGGGYCHDP